MESELVRKTKPAAKAQKNHVAAGPRRPGPGIALDKDDEDELEDDDEDELDEDDAEEEAEDEAEDTIRRLQRRLKAAAGEAQISVYRRFPGRDKTYVDSIRLAAAEAMDYREHVVARFGGSGKDGSYVVLFKIEGRYAGTDTFQAEGEPIPVRRDGSPAPLERAAAPLEAAPTQAGPMTAEAIERIIEARMAKAAEAAAVEALRRENAELKAALSRPREPVAPPVSVTETALGIVKAINDQADRSVTKIRAQEDPELVALKARMEAAEKESEALKEKLREKEQKELNLRFDTLQAELRAALRSNERQNEKKPSPIIEALGALAEVTAVDRAFAHMRDAAEDEETTGGLLTGALAQMKGPLAAAITGMAKTVMEGVQEQMAKKPQQLPGPAQQRPQGQPAGPAVDRDRWKQWVSAIFADPTLTQNVDFVAGGLQESFNPWIARLMVTGDREGLAVFLGETVDKPTGDMIRGLPPEHWNAVLGCVNTLKATVMSIAEGKTAPTPPQAASAPEAKAPTGASAPAATATTSTAAPPSPPVETGASAPTQASAPVQVTAEPMTPEEIRDAFEGEDGDEDDGEDEDEGPAAAGG